MPRSRHTPRCHAAIDLQEGVSVELPTELAHHLLKVLRASSGDPIRLFNGDGREFAATLQVQGKRAIAELGVACEPERESPLLSRLLQAVSRGDRMENTLRQSVELGVNEIWPLYTRHSVAALPAARAEKKRAHWEQVIIGACQQSGRVLRPALRSAQSLPAVMNALGPVDKDELRAVLTPDATRALTRCLPGRGKLTLLVGPESGLDEDEVALACAHDFVSVSLGPRILRTQTAGPTALAIAQALVGDCA